MNMLLATYKEIVQNNTNIKFESYNVVELVNNYRLYWKPEKVKTIILAESHVFTNSNEMAVQHNVNLPGYPKNYVRFVYNLAYGQNNTLAKPITNNTGTPQFWKLFNEISGNNFRVVNNNNSNDKLKQKIELLKFLKEYGVWLLDCSIVGLYHNGQKPSPNVMNGILLTSYLNFCKPFLLKEQPDNVLVIGRSIYSLLQHELIKLNAHFDWIHQPNARVTANKRRDLTKVKFNCV